jgi:hypothetical protein
MINKTKKRTLTKKENNNFRKNSKKIRLKQCSPRKGTEYKTCFSRPSLKRIIKYWNSSNPNDEIIIKDKDSRYVIWSKINKKLKSICDNEYCWLEQSFIKDRNELKHDYKPKMPNSWEKNKNEWLTTSDIESVMNQYMKKHSDFLFIGAVPIDFDTEMTPGMCVVNELCRIKVSQLLKQGINQIGIVFNLDPHDKPGSHWVSFYGNFKTGKLFYFDSYGFEPPSQVEELVKRLKDQGSQNNIPIMYDFNKVRHQYKNSECGVYSINFIENMLNGVEFNTFCNRKIPDDKMELFRKKYFIRL